MDTCDYGVVITNLCKSYGKHEVFKDLNMKFLKNKITVILGPSGCGKTTLLNIISGIEKEDSGKVILEDSSVSYIFQEDRLIPDLTVYQNIAFVLKSNMDKADVNKTVDKYLSMVKLKEYRNELPSKLSGGMKRRVAIARALAYNSRLILMDEPFSGLDDKLKNDIINDFLEVNKENKRTVIIVTHDTREAEMLGGTIYSIV